MRFFFTLVIIALCCSTFAGGLAIINADGIEIGICGTFSWSDTSIGFAISSVLFVVAVVVIGLEYVADWIYKREKNQVYGLGLIEKINL